MVYRVELAGRATRDLGYIYAGIDAGRVFSRRPMV